MLKLNNKNTRTYFTPFSSVPTVDFEEINVSCEISFSMTVHLFY